MTLNFNERLELEITLPREQSFDVDEILGRNKKWIQKKHQQLLSSRKIFQGRRVMYRGRYLEVKIVRPSDLHQRPVMANGDSLVVCTLRAKRAHSLIKLWMTSETDSLVRRKAEVYAERLGVRLGIVQVKDMRKWGFCTDEGRLVFPWHLVALPDELAEYIVLHEVAHLKEFSHSRAFKMTMESILPDHIDRKRELKSIWANDLTTLLFEDPDVKKEDM